MSHRDRSLPKTEIEIVARYDTERIWFPGTQIEKSIPLDSQGRAQTLADLRYEAIQLFEMFGAYCLMARIECKVNIDALLAESVNIELFPAVDPERYIEKCLQSPLDDDGYGSIAPVAERMQESECEIRQHVTVLFADHSYRNLLQCMNEEAFARADCGPFEHLIN